MNEVGVDERGEVVFLILNPSLLLDDTSNHTVEELVMSVLFETSLGDIIVDLETTLCPTLSLNFLKLCKTFSYNFNSFHHVIPQFIAQTGDPTDTGSGGTSIFHQLPRTSKDYQKDPFFVPPTKELGQTTRLKHNSAGILSMAMANGGIGSQFFFTLGGNEESLDYLDGKHVVFGKVVEGLETLDKVNESLLDQQGKPLRDIRIRHVIVLDDPFPDPEGLLVPPDSPTPTSAQLASLRVGEDELLPSDSEDPELLASKRRQDDARAQALTLEMVGDLPFADVAPPENVLFICKLNQVTTSEDLELIFSRFGEVLSCEIIRDEKTGDSLQYGFIEFKERDSAEKAFVKMDNVLVDDRRIHVDFSQSVSKLHNSWVYNKTGGRPPPNKHRKRDNNDNDDDDRHDRRGGGGGSRTRGREEDLVFDLDQVDSERRGGGGGGGQRRSGRREEYDPRGPGRGVRDDRTRRGDQDRGSYVGGGGHGRRRDERDRSPRGGNGGGGGYDRRDRERERDRERDRRR